MRIDYLSNLTSDNVLVLYWYYIVIKEKNKKEVISYNDFKVTQSLINEFNDYCRDWEKKYESNPSLHKVVNWDLDRNKTDYYETQLNIAHQFEIYVEKEFKKRGIDLGAYSDTRQYEGENEFGLEIKNDLKNLETGNYYIEYKERMKNSMDWVDSGILKNDNSKFILLGNENNLAIFEKRTLLNIYNELVIKGQNVYGCKMVAENTHGTSKGFIIFKNAINRYCFATSIDEFIDKIKENKNEY